MLSFWEVVLLAIRQRKAKINTDPGLVEEDYHEEVAELNIELIREHNHMKPGPDGVVGEAIDVNMMTIHVALTREPDITEASAVKRAIPKLEKWLGCPLEIPPPPLQFNIVWERGPAQNPGVAFYDGERYLVATLSGGVGDAKRHWVFDFVSVSVCEDQERDDGFDGSATITADGSDEDIPYDCIFWFVPLNEISKTLPDLNQ